MNSTNNKWPSVLDLRECKIPVDHFYRRSSSYTHRNETDGILKQISYSLSDLLKEEIESANFGPKKHALGKDDAVFPVENKCINFWGIEICQTTSTDTKPLEDFIFNLSDPLLDVADPLIGKLVEYGNKTSRNLETIAEECIESGKPSVIHNDSLLHLQRIISDDEASETSSVNSVAEVLRLEPMSPEYTSAYEAKHCESLLEEVWATDSALPQSTRKLLPAETSVASITQTVVGTPSVNEKLCDAPSVVSLEETSAAASSLTPSVNRYLVDTSSFTSLKETSLSPTIKETLTKTPASIETLNGATISSLATSIREVLFESPSLALLTKETLASSPSEKKLALTSSSTPSVNEYLAETSSFTSLKDSSSALFIKETLTRTPSLAPSIKETPEKLISSPPKTEISLETPSSAVVNYPFVSTPLASTYKPQGLLNTNVMTVDLVSPLTNKFPEPSSTNNITHDLVSPLTNKFPEPSNTNNITVDLVSPLTKKFPEPSSTNNITFDLVGSLTNRFHKPSDTKETKDFKSSECYKPGTSSSNIPCTSGFSKSKPSLSGNKDKNSNRVVSAIHNLDFLKKKTTTSKNASTSNSTENDRPCKPSTRLKLNRKPVSVIKEVTQSKRVCQDDFQDKISTGIPVNGDYTFDKDEFYSTKSGGSNSLTDEVDEDFTVLDAAEGSDSSVPLKSYMMPFRSNNHQENLDNEDPDWSHLKKLETDEQRYQFSRSRWKSLVVPDPNMNLTTYSFRCSRRQKRKEGKHSQDYNNNSKKRKLTKEEQLQGRPPNKRIRRFNLDFCYSSVDASIRALKKEYYNRHGQNSRNQYRSFMEKMAMLDIAKSEVTAIDKFYSGLPDQDLSISQRFVEEEHEDTCQIYDHFRDIYNWDGKVLINNR